MRNQLTLTLPALFLFLLLVIGCTAAEPVLIPPEEPAVAIAAVEATEPLSPTAEPSPSPTETTAAPPETATPTAPPTATLPPTPYYTGELSPPCGQLLPLVLPEAGERVYSFNGSTAAVARTAMPTAARPAFDYILENPQNVGLVAYRLGDEANGVYLNGERPMPLASVVKIIHLVAYVEAVERGELNPDGRVPLDVLERYYIDRSDLGSHQRAINDLEEQGKIDAGRTVALQDVAWMMMRYSSNAATDYIHQLLGQTRIEQTVIELGLENHTAPCMFLGQFLAMENPVRGVGGSGGLADYLADPAVYAAESGRLADAYINDTLFRQSLGRWRPSTQTQRTYVDNLGGYGRPVDYAQLMGRIALNGLSSGESSYQARLIIEWPMNFAANQQLFTNLGYKDGNLPGVLTTAYYAYPRDGGGPIVVILFYKDLPQELYRTWRRSLTHDEFARWLLYDPAALGWVRAVVGGGN